MNWRLKSKICWRMLDKVDLDVGYDLQGVYKKEIDNYLKIRVYI